MFFFQGILTIQFQPQIFQSCSLASFRDASGFYDQVPQYFLSPEVQEVLKMFFFQHKTTLQK